MATIKTPVDAIDAAVQSLSGHIANLKNRRDTLKVGKVRTMLLKLLTPLMYAVGKAGDVSVGMNSNGNPYIYVVMYDLDSFKQYELAAVLEYLTAQTDKLGGVMLTEDWPASINRDFKFRTDKWDATVAAYVKGDSATCRRIVVGTEIKEVEKYEIVCD